jgi:TonB family protein
MVPPPPHPDPPRPSPVDRRLLSPTSAAERARVGKRLLWALPVALGVLALLTLFGPSAEEVERKFTPYGAEGPLRLMPEIAIEEGLDPQQQRARQEVAPPPPAPEYQVEPEDSDEDAKEIAPEVAEEAAPITDTGRDSEAPVQEVQATESDGDAAVDMLMPSQHADSDFIITKLVRPLYPARASQQDRLRPVITVKAAFFVNEKGEVVAITIESNDGGPEFAESVRKAMDQWEFQPRLRDGVPPAPRWLVVSWRFRSPFSGVGG